MKKFPLTENQKRILAALLLLALWQAAAMLLGNRILLASPFDVVKRLFTVWQEEGFVSSLKNSFTRIAGGFLLAFVLGTALGFLAGRVHAAEILLSPLMLTIKSVPVASFIIIALVWLSSAKLATFISFLMVLPVIYNNVLAGVKGIGRKTLEVAEVFRMPFGKRFRFIWMPQVKPYLLSGCSTALGMAWKSGIAAEVIGIPKNSIGENLYLAKAYFNTTDLFAWTVIIVLISLVFEKAFLALLKNLFAISET